MMRRSLFAVAVSLMTVSAVGAFTGTVAMLDSEGAAPRYYSLA